MRSETIHGKLEGCGCVAQSTARWRFPSLSSWRRGCSTRSIGAGALGGGVVGPALHPVRPPFAPEHVPAIKCRCLGAGVAHDRRGGVGRARPPRASDSCILSDRLCGCFFLFAAKVTEGGWGYMRCKLGSCSSFAGVVNQFLGAPTSEETGFASFRTFQVFSCRDCVASHNVSRGCASENEPPAAGSGFEHRKTVSFALRER